MVGKVISGSSFSGTVGYVMKEESRILEAEGIMPPEVKQRQNARRDPRRGRFSRYQRRIGTNRGRRNEYVNVTVSGFDR